MVRLVMNTLISSMKHEADVMVHSCALACTSALIQANPYSQIEPLIQAFLGKYFFKKRMLNVLPIYELINEIFVRNSHLITTCIYISHSYFKKMSLMIQIHNSCGRI